MKGFSIRTKKNQLIRCRFYMEEAPITSAAFANALPFTGTFYHARVSGQEIWIDNGPELDIIQENASVFTTPGEIVLGPLKPVRTKTSKCMGIYYGEGRGLDACNIFGKVMDEDMHLLTALGNDIWRHGEQELLFELLD